MKRYIVVDDDPINNLVCQLNIKKFKPTAEIKTFTKPEEALDFVRDEKKAPDTVLLLDINMPTMSAWEFMAEYSQMDSEIKKTSQYLFFPLHLKTRLIKFKFTRKFAVFFRSR